MIYAPIPMTLSDLLLHMPEFCCCGEKCLPIENLHTVVQEFSLILLEKETYIYIYTGEERRVPFIFGRNNQ